MLRHKIEAEVLLLSEKFDNMGKLEHENPQEISGLNSPTYLWSSDYFFFNWQRLNGLIYSIQMF